MLNFQEISVNYEQVLKDTKYKVKSREMLQILDLSYIIKNVKNG